MSQTTVFLAVLALLIGACGRSSPSRFSAEQLRAEFPSDLGPNEVDVSAYPEAQRANYQLFRERCTVCHSAARAINAPFIDRKTWVRYVFKMHGKALRRFEKPLLEGEEGRRVIDFLVYDARERKLKNPLRWVSDYDRLLRLMDDIREERSRARWVMTNWDSRQPGGRPEGPLEGEPPVTANPEKDAGQED